MADLSGIFKEQIPANITTLISKDIEIRHICQLKKENLSAKYIKVKSAFESDKTSFILTYLIPGNFSSYIFNIMMMDEGAEITDEVDEEKADAIKEIVATINGSCATAISGANLDDVGQIKIAGNDAELIDNIDSLDLTDSFIKFELKIENKVFDFIINFSNEAKPFFEELFSTQECLDLREENKNQEQNEGEETKSDSKNDNSDQKEESEDQKQDESKKENNDEKGSEEITKNENQEQQEQNESKDDDNSNQNEENENQDQTNKEEKTDVTNKDEDDKNEQDLKKAKKLKLLIIIIASLLVLVIGGFTIAYFMGVFEPPPPPPKKIHKNPRKNKLLKIELKDKKIDFKLSMINVNRLNKRLSFLTKYEILDNDILEKFKQEERIRLQKLKVKKLEQFAKANKEESLKNVKKENFSIENRFIYIQIEPLKYKKYKKIIDSKLPPHSNISICLDKNKKAQIYVGPLVDKEKANILVKDIKEIDHKKDTKLISLTKDEFNKLCDF